LLIFHAKRHPAYQIRRKNQVGRESISAVVASTLTADKVFYPVAFDILSAVSVFHPVASGILSAVTMLAQIAEVRCRT
jgi:hypothetical protein